MSLPDIPHAAERRALLVDLALAVVASAAFGVVLVLAFKGIAADARPAGRGQAIGRVESATNDVRHRADGSLVWGAAGAGSSVNDRDAVYVGSDSEAVVVLVDGSRLELDAASLVVVRLPEKRDPQRRGSMTVEVVRGGASSVAQGSMVLRARGATLRLDGSTRARVVVRPDGSTQLNVAAGRAEVSTASGTTSLGQEQQQLVGPDGAAGPVQQVGPPLRTPAAGARVYFTARRPDLTFRWDGVAGTGPYRFELSRDSGFREVVARVAVTAPEYTHRAAPAGAYHWRVRREGMSGARFSEERKVVVVEDRPPVLYEPQGGELVQPPGAAISFAWSRVRDERAYLLEVDHDERFAAPILRQARDAQHFVLGRELAERRHCARVRHTARPDAPWSRPRCFEVLRKPRLDAPEVLDPTLDRGTPRGSPP